MSAAAEMVLALEFCRYAIEHSEETNDRLRLAQKIAIKTLAKYGPELIENFQRSDYWARVGQLYTDFANAPEPPVWIVGKVTDYEANGWEFQGVYHSKAEAVASCRDSKYFVGPALLNLPLADVSTKWEGAFYPLAPAT